MHAFELFWHLDNRNLHTINEALLPKKDNAKMLKDYRPISLIHVMGKLLSKVLAKCMVPHLDSLIHHSQSAFIKGRFIEDNFRFVRSSAHLFQAHKLPWLLLKVDIARAFNSVACPFLLEVLKHLGFHDRWLQWMFMLLSSIHCNGTNGLPVPALFVPNNLLGPTTFSRCPTTRSIPTQDRQDGR
jgi:hypothetical protein